MKQGKGAAAKGSHRFGRQACDRIGGIDDPPHDGQSRMVERNMLLPAQVKRLADSILRRHLQKRGTVGWTGPDVGEAGAFGGRGSRIADRVAGEGDEPLQLATGLAGGAGAGQ